MSESMIERVARAICKETNIAMEGVTETVFDCPDAVYMRWVRGEGHHDPIPRWTLYIPQARAAIEAMREPTNKMYDAAHDGAAPGDPNTFGEMWSNAIDAALKEAP